MTVVVVVVVTSHPKYRALARDVGIYRNILIQISALASAPSRPPNPTLTPQNQASSKNPRSKVPKTQKTGCAYSEHYTN